MKSPVEIWNGIADKVVGAEVEMILAPIGRTLKDLLIELGVVLTDYMPEVGAGVTIICAVGMMINGNIPKWFARWGVGIMGVIIWLTVGK